MTESKKYAPKSLVLVVSEMGWGGSYYEPFQEFGEKCLDLTVLDTDPGAVALVVFTGGEDVTPSLYGHRPSFRTYNSPARDRFEQAAYAKALALGLPMAGVCRGAQFLCAMAGGTLIQHVENHGRAHPVRISDGRLIEMTSTHHQMCVPPAGAELIGWAEPSRSQVYVGEADEPATPPDREAEVVYYPGTKAVGMQYHPENMNRRSEGFRFAAEVVRTRLGVAPRQPAA